LHEVARSVVKGAVPKFRLNRWHQAERRTMQQTKRSPARQQQLSAFSCGISRGKNSQLMTRRQSASHRQRSIMSAS
jgi:hypothetical protein